MGKARRLSARQLLAANLRKERVRLNLSQEGLAGAAGVSQTYVSQIESSQRAVSIDVIEALAEALEIEIADLLRR